MRRENFTAIISHSEPSVWFTTISAADDLLRFYLTKSRGACANDQLYRILKILES